MANLKYSEAQAKNAIRAMEATDVISLVDPNGNDTDPDPARHASQATNARQLKTYVNLPVINGFPMWDDLTLMFKSDLTSLTSLTLSGGVETGAGSHTYDAGGVILEANSGMAWNGLTDDQRAALAIEGTLTCWIESSYVDSNRIPLAHEYLMGIWSDVSGQLGTLYSQNRALSSLSTSIFFNNTTSPGSQTMLESIEGADQYVRLDLSSTGPNGKPTLYIDYVPAAETDVPWPTEDRFINITFGGRGDTPASPAGFRIKNFMVSTKAVAVTVNPNTSRVVLGGHSYIANSDYPTQGVITGDSGEGTSRTGTRGITATLHGKLFNFGDGLKLGMVNNHAVGGSKINDVGVGLQDQLTTALAQDTEISIYLTMWGANEIVTNELAWDVEYGPGGTAYDFKAIYQQGINDMFAAGAKFLLILNQPYLSEQHPTAAGQAYRDRVDGLNADIQELSDENSNVFHIDVFNLLGGQFSSDPINWGGADGTDQLHPNLTSSGKIGKLCARTILPHI